MLYPSIYALFFQRVSPLNYLIMIPYKCFNPPLSQPYIRALHCTQTWGPSLTAVHVITDHLTKHSSLVPEDGYPHWLFCGFLQALHTNSTVVYDSLLLLIKFIIQINLSPMLHDLDSWRSVGESTGTQCNSATASLFHSDLSIFYLSDDFRRASPQKFASVSFPLYPIYWHSSL
jgi:hypothetical protein